MSGAFSLPDDIVDVVRRYGYYVGGDVYSRRRIFFVDPSVRLSASVVSGKNQSDVLHMAFARRLQGFFVSEAPWLMVLRLL